jgi:hypothetical protein
MIGMGPANWLGGSTLKMLGAITHCATIASTSFLAGLGPKLGRMGGESQTDNKPKPSLGLGLNGPTGPMGM